MGVNGLLKLLQPYSESRHVSSYRGQTLAVDGYSWLHRAAASCADDIFHGKTTTKLVKSIDNRILSYVMYGVSLYFVFDGSPLGIKSRIEKERKARRIKASSEIKNGFKASYQQSMRGLEITANHAAMVIALLKQRQIRYVVAPFEADAQMVWLEKQGLVQGIISEDSDLLVFGAQRLLTKSDPKSGTCVELCNKKFPADLQSLDSLRTLAIISGCDYSEGVSGLGPVKTGALVRKMGGKLEAMLESLLLTNRITEEFAESARQAELSFRHQRVWDVQKNTMAFLNEPETEDIELGDDYVGGPLNRSVAHKIALGIVDPHNFDKQLVVSPIINQFVLQLKPVATANAFSAPKHSVSKSQTPLRMQNAINRRLSSSSLENTSIKSPFFQQSATYASSSQSLQLYEDKENLLYQNKAQKVSASKSSTIVDSCPLQENRENLPTTNLFYAKSEVSSSSKCTENTLKRKSSFELTKESSSSSTQTNDEIPESDDYTLETREQTNKFAFLNKFKYVQN